MDIVTADIGGTNARFAIAALDGGRVGSLSRQMTLSCADHASLATAWEAYGERIGDPLPRSAAIAVAGPVHGDIIKLTNNPWIIRPAQLERELGLDRLVLVNDFGAVAHAVQQLPDSSFTRLCGPDIPLPHRGMISIVGPGTGLGVAAVLRAGDHYHVIETEGGHVDFAPLDRIEDAILDRLRLRHTRVSVERVVSGPGLAMIHEALASIEGRSVKAMEDADLWALAMSGEDSLAAASFDRFCQCLGAAAGDYALAQGAAGVVIAGGLGQRIGARLGGSGFEERFVAKGRFRQMMAALPVKLMAYPEPGLFGAAAAFAQLAPES